MLEFSVSTNTLSRAGLTYNEGEIKNIHYGDILVKFDSIVDINLPEVPFIAGAKVEDYENQLLQNGDIIIADTAEDETTGKVVEITGISDNYAVSGLHTIVARPNEIFAQRYLGYYLNSQAYRNQLLPLMQGIKVLSLSKTNIAQTKVVFPNDTTEQDKIGIFFHTLDTTIANYKRKLDGLRELKKAYLQVMFPQAGEVVPRMRFEGFSAEWVDRKLGETVEIVGGGTPDTTNADYWDGDIIWYSPVEIGKEIYVSDSQRKITELGLKRSSAKMLPADRTILFTSRAGIGDMAILKNPASTNQGFQSFVVSVDVDVYFIYSMGGMIKDYALKNASGSTFLEISGKSMSKMIILLPSHKEQTLIGGFFRTLDEQITAQTKKLEQIQQLKASYLQKMFV